MTFDSDVRGQWSADQLIRGPYGWRNCSSRGGGHVGTGNLRRGIRGYWTLAHLQIGWQRVVLVDQSANLWFKSCCRLWDLFSNKTC